MSPRQRNPVLPAWWPGRRPAQAQAPVIPIIRPKLSAGANAVLDFALKHGSISTAKVDELLAQHQPLSYRRTPARHPVPSKAREVCMNLVDDGHLTFGEAPDTWTPSRNLKRETGR